MKVSEFQEWKNSGTSASFAEWKKAGKPKRTAPAVVAPVTASRPKLSAEARAAVAELVARARADQALSSTERAICERYKIDPSDLTNAAHERERRFDIALTDADKRLAQKMGIPESEFAVHKSRLYSGNQ